MAKDRKSVENLKNMWLQDPNWDLEDTEGFEEHYTELLEFGNSKRIEWAEKAQLLRQAKLKSTLAFPIDAGEGGIEGGLTKREWFAGMALQGLCSQENIKFAAGDNAAELSVSLAELLIEELNK